MGDTLWMSMHVYRLPKFMPETCSYLCLTRILSIYINWFNFMCARRRSHIANQTRLVTYIEYTQQSIGLYIASSDKRSFYLLLRRAQHRKMSYSNIYINVALSASIGLSKIVMQFAFTSHRHDVIFPVCLRLVLRKKMYNNTLLDDKESIYKYDICALCSHGWPSHHRMVYIVYPFRALCVSFCIYFICHWTDRYTLHMGRCLVPLKGRQDVVAACPMACEIPLCVLRVVPGKERWMR